MVQHIHIWQSARPQYGLDCLPAIHFVSHNNLISSIDSLRCWDGGAVARAADITVQALELNMLNIPQVVCVQASISKDVRESRSSKLCCAYGTWTGSDSGRYELRRRITLLSFQVLMNASLSRMTLAG